MTSAAVCNKVFRYGLECTSMITTGNFHSIRSNVNERSTTPSGRLSIEHKNGVIPFLNASIEISAVYDTSP